MYNNLGELTRLEGMKGRKNGFEEMETGRGISKRLYRMGTREVGWCS